MQKKGENRLYLSPKAGKIALNFCRAHGRDLDEFLEEAIMEKIEFDEMNSDTASRHSRDTRADMADLFIEEAEDGEFKKKH